MLQFSALGTLGVAATILCWSLAALLYRVETIGGQARQLAFLLVVEGVAVVSTGFIDMFLAGAVREQDWYPTLLQGEAVAHTFGDCAMLALYPAFLGAVLQTRLTEPFRGKSMRLGVAVAALVLFFAALFTPLQVGATILYLLLSLLFGFGLVASIHAWRVAETGAARARAGAFALAFGFRDVCWGLVYGGSIWLIFTDQYAITIPDAPGQTWILLSLVYACGTLLYVPLIAYGILRTRLFDIDLRIRWTIRQSTVASVFVAIFYLVSEGVDRFLASELGNLAGLLAAALVVFFLAPLQRFADRVAGAAMPNTQNTPEYVAFRKMQVYEEAVAEAQSEGGISDKERALLVRLRDSLGISAADAELIERELRARSGARADAP